MEAIIEKYTEIVSRRDLRVENWFLMSSPWPTLSICLAYVLIVKVIGPKFMEKREPFDLRNVLVIYNGLQVVFSAWLFYEYGRGGWFHGYSFTCQPVDYSNNEMAIRGGWLRDYSFTCQPVAVDYSDSALALRMVHACWWYYFSKYTEFFDTFFFVLRKKYNHVSLLHVIHHGCMPMSVWFGVKFTPGGHSTFFGLLNTFVHVVMYFYYMVAAMGPRYQKYIWWKKHLTNFQMVQFILIATHAFQLLFIECNYPKAFVWWIGCHGVLFLFLFSSFYTKAYTRSKSTTKEQRKSSPKVCEEDEKDPSIMNLVDSNSNGIDLRQRKQLKGH